MHARERWLSVRELLWRIAWGRTLILHLLLRHLVLHRRSAAWLVTDALSAHHSLDLVQAHQLPGRDGLRCGGVRLALRLMVAWLSLLLGLQTPNVCTGFQLRNILGIFVALVATPVGLRSLRDGRLVLLLRVALAGLEEHLLLLQDVGDLGGLAGEVEVLVNRLLDGRPSEGVVVEGVVGIVEAITEAMIRLFKVDARSLLRNVTWAAEAQHTHHHRLPLHCSAQRKHRAGQSRGHWTRDRGHVAGCCRIQRTTWWVVPVVGWLLVVDECVKY